MRARHRALSDPFIATARALAPLARDHPQLHKLLLALLVSTPAILVDIILIGILHHRLSVAVGVCIVTFVNIRVIVSISWRRRVAAQTEPGAVDSTRRNS